MSTNIDMLDLTSYHYSRAERYCDLASVALLSYEYLLQFTAEVELFWKKRWSYGKILFLFSRYWPLVFNTVDAWAYLTERPTQSVYVDATGRQFMRFNDVAVGLQAVTTHVILCLRIYAMYGSTRRMLALCGCLLASEVIVIIIIYTLQHSGLISSNTAAPGVYICADGDAPGDHWISYYWTTLLVTDSTLLSLSLYKGWQNWRSGDAPSIVRVLMRDSVLFFFAIFCVYMLNQILWLYNIIALNELGTGLATSVSTVCANRLMISVRRHYYGHEHQLDEQAISSVRFTNGRSHTTEAGEGTKAFGESSHATTVCVEDDMTFGGSDDEYEMEEFSERRGF